MARTAFLGLRELERNKSFHCQHHRTTRNVVARKFALFSQPPPLWGSAIVPARIRRIPDFFPLLPNDSSQMPSSSLSTAAFSPPQGRPLIGRRGCCCARSSPRLRGVRGSQPTHTWLTPCSHPAHTPLTPSSHSTHTPLTLTPTHTLLTPSSHCTHTHSHPLTPSSHPPHTPGPGGTQPTAAQPLAAGAGPQRVRRALTSGSADP